MLLIVQPVRLLARTGLDGGVQSVRWPGRDWSVRGSLWTGRTAVDWMDCQELHVFARFYAIYTQREKDPNLLTVYKVEYIYCKSTSHSAASISSIALISSLVAATSPSRCQLFKHSSIVPHATASMG